MKNRYLRIAAGLILAAAAAAWVQPASASVFLKIDRPTLAKMSESVVHARVMDIQSAWNSDHTFIFTEVTLQVLGRLKGSSDDQIVVRVPGGTVDDFTAVMEGAPEFTLDDEVVAHIARWHDGVPMVAGYFQGLSRVTRDQVGNSILKGGLADGMPMSELARELGRSGR